MKYNYKFSNLMGTVYNKGNVQFLEDGNTVVSPVGNRISLYDLKSNKSETLPISLKRNISCLAVSPNNYTMLAIDEEGEAFMISLKNKTIIHQKHMGKPIRSVSFSPDGSKFAITKENQILMYHAPGKGRELNPFTLIRKFYGAYSDTTCIDWTTDSRVFAVGGVDRNVRVYAAQRLVELVIYSVDGHKDEIMGCFFEEDSLDFYSVSKDGALCCWSCDTDLSDLTEIVVKKVDPVAANEILVLDEEDEEEEEEKSSAGEMIVVKKSTVAVQKVENKLKYKRDSRQFYNKEGDFNNVTSCHFHKKSRILVTGFASGAFYLHELPEFNLVHSLSITDHPVTAVQFNSTGDWLALASSSLGQLMVWEWQSESYIMKQQGHIDAMRSLDYSPDGQYIVTGGEDSKVKVWNTSSGFCFVTFKEHASPVTQVLFTSSGQVILSASLDGTVRAFDLIRYRNFRTFYATGEDAGNLSQLTSLTVDASGEFVCAGSSDNFKIFLWSMKTGHLLDVLDGHEAPVVSLSFSPCDMVLASGSWDKTVTLWTIGCEKPSRESLQLGHDVLAITFRPDGKQLAVSTLNAELTFWSVEDCVQQYSIDCKLDIVSGRGEMDRVSAKNSSSGKAYETICYSADGQVVIVGGFSKYICLYHVEQQVMLKRFEVCDNLSFDGMEEFLSRRKMTEFGPQALIDMGGDEDSGSKIRLPGVRRGDMSARVFKPEIRVPAVRFSPAGREWAAVTTEGLLVYSLDNVNVFDPFHLDIEITPSNIRDTIAEKNYIQAVIMCFRLNRQNLTEEIMEQVPSSEIAVMSKQLPLVYVEKMLTFVSGQLESSSHTHFYLLWARSLLLHHGAALKKRSGQITPIVTHLQKALTRKDKEITKLLDGNHYLMTYIFKTAQIYEKRNVENFTPNRLLDDDEEVEMRSIGDDESDDDDIADIIAEVAAQ